ncbi:MAG: bifunctional adenosylcobinamide kinase/adenosylcobinamide-phosphate guanylyltransferase [Pseudomonadota bacterium]
MKTHRREFTLVLGGAASGKSSFAESLFQDLADRNYIATAQAFDDEMAVKIAAHQASRGADWTTHEAPIALASTLRTLTGSAVLIDCATIWLSNLLLDDRDWSHDLDGLLEVIETHSDQLVIVSNEVGTAPVPTTSLGRAFQNAQGAVNQRLAARADRVFLVTAGLPMALK